MNQSLGRATTVLIAGIALTIASGAGAVAGSLITGKDIKNGTVTHKDLAQKSVRSGQVKDGALTGDDVGDGTLTGLHLADGSVTRDDLAADVKVGVTHPYVTLNVPPGAHTLPAKCPDGTLVMWGNMVPGGTAFYTLDSELVDPAQNAVMFKVDGGTTGGVLQAQLACLSQ